MLAANITHVLADNLALLLEAERVAAHPWPSGLGLDYQVEVEIIRFEARRAGTALLHARWLIRSAGDNKVLKVGLTDLSDTSRDGAYESIVAAQSRLLETMSREIADALLALWKPAAAG